MKLLCEAVLHEPTWVRRIVPSVSDQTVFLLPAVGKPTAAIISMHAGYGRQSDVAVRQRPSGAVANYEQYSGGLGSGANRNVASAATDLRQNAVRVSANAEETSHQASAASYVSGQALANGQKAKATEEISRQIVSVQEETRGTVAAIDGIMTVITEISDIATTIASAVEEQGVSTQEIARTVQEDALGTREVNDNIAGVTKAASNTGAALNQVLESAQQFSHQAEGLRAEVELSFTDVRAV